MHTQQKATNIFKAQIFQAICQKCENFICSSVVLTDTSMKGVANSERSKKDGGGDNG